ncbi:oligosaccharide repeat unit polymerase [Bacillus sp. CMF12]|uniref:O-antigen polymerase n=1 Tax=Bacillus sp. CMF12 TaxID=2884834 RepID=UPI00207A1966|nr:O-antigen polymerase [Bacillus sp. CMF12]USK49619.1 oligosaccharide repeat unit polymerase [Bacillus sp. CMF12]
MSLIYSLVLVKKITGGILLPKLFNVVYLFFLLFVFIGGYFLYINENFSDRSAVFMSIISIILTMYLLPIGYAFSKVMMKKKEIYSFELPFKSSPQRINQKGLILTIFIIISSCYLYYSNLVSIPIFSVFDSSIQSKYALAQLRSDATNSMSYENKNYLYKLLVGYRDFIQITLLSFVTGYVFLKYKHNKKTFNLILFLLLFVLLIFNSISALKKADIIFALLFLYFLNSYDNYKRNHSNKFNRLKIFKLSGIFSLGFIILIFLYSLFMKIPLTNISLIISSIFERVFISSVKPLYYYFSTFPEHHDFLFGKSFSPTVLGGLFKYEIFNLENYIYNFIFYDISARGITGTAPTVFIGEVYANFGFIIMMLSILLVGFILGYLERNLENLNYSYLNVSFYVIIAFIIKDISISSIQSIIGFPLLISKAIMFMLFFYFILIPRSKNNYNRFENSLKSNNLVR